MSGIKPDYYQINKFFDAFAWFITHLFVDEDNDDFLESENRYSVTQLEWAIKKFVSFYIDNKVIGDYSISKLISSKKLIDIDLVIMYANDVITYNVRHKF